MALTKTNNDLVFDTDEIKRGDVISLQHKEDTEAVNGIVATVTPGALTVFYLPKMSNVSNYIVIRVAEAKDWYSIKWSRDLTETKEATE